MDAEVKRKWIEALRNGEFRQGREFLHNMENDTFCCLGVLARICGVREDDMGAKASAFYFGEPDDYYRGTIPRGFKGLRDDEINHLIRMNDGGRTFDEIAEWIDAEIPADDSALAGRAEA